MLIAIKPLELGPQDLVLPANFRELHARVIQLQHAIGQLNPRGISRLHLRVE